MYFLLSLKKALKKYPSILIITLSMVLGIALTAIMIIRGDASTDKKMAYSIGVVGDTSETFFDVGIDVIKSKLYIDLITMTEDDAKKALEQDKITGYLKIPKNFIHDIASMKNTPAEFYITNKPNTLGTVLTREVIDTVSVYVIESQRVASGLRSFIKSNKLPRGNSVDEISSRLLKNILVRSKLYEPEYIGVADNLSTGGYYLVGLLLFLMLLWGISCSVLLIKKDLSLSQFMYSRGIGITRQVSSEYAVYLLTSFVTLIAVTTIFGIVTSYFDIGIIETDGVGISGCIRYIIRILPAITAICAMQFFMYEVVFGTVSSILLQFLSSLILAYLTGCFYPNHFFPETIRSVVNILPPGVAFDYMRKALISEFDFKSFFILVGYTVFFVTASYVVRNWKMAGDSR